GASFSFRRLLKKQKLLRGETGRVRFDDRGDRLDSDYDILNVVRGNHAPVGQYWSMSMELDLELDRVVWPGNRTETPLGYVIPKHLKVATIAERPFVWVRPVPDESDCLPSEIFCPWTNSSDGIAYPFCCEGYCMDLLQSLSQKLNFTYTLYQVQDGQYGTFDFVNGSTHKRWSGMVGDLVRGVADMIIAPLTITPERSMEIEFTKPFKYQGITILAKKANKSSTLASFLQPFQKTLWILVMVSVHVVALALYLLDRFSPFGRYKLPNSDATEEDALNLSSAIWFAWGVLLNSGIAEGTPRSFSGRVLGMVWAGFAMIVVASYTANLAAFLVLEKPESSLSGINDPRVGGVFSEYFTRVSSPGDETTRGRPQREMALASATRILPHTKTFSSGGAPNIVNDLQLDAFIWDSSRLEFEAAQHCELVTAGEQFGRSGYGIGLQRNSFWVDKVTLTLLEMHESESPLSVSFIILSSRQGEDTVLPRAWLGPFISAGVFILVGAGIVGGIGLIVIEIVYKKHQTRKQRRLELARHAADKWRGAVEVSQHTPTLFPTMRHRGVQLVAPSAVPLTLSGLPQNGANIHQGLNSHWNDGHRSLLHHK
ncbi:glutamate receptor, putative, partial [Ixodes scapularis]